MRAIADSGALYALYDKDDAHHQRCINLLKKSKCALIVPAAILSEVDYLLREFLGVAAELDFLDALMGGLYLLEPFTEADLNRCRELVAAYRDLDLGLADASVIATAERLNVRNLFTVDYRHFRAVKPRSGVLSLLPADA